jgi:hypothetical protein
MYRDTISAGKPHLRSPSSSMYAGQFRNITLGFIGLPVQRDRGRAAVEFRLR